MLLSRAHARTDGDPRVTDFQSRGVGLKSKEIALPNIECDNGRPQMLQTLDPEPPETARRRYGRRAEIPT